MTDTPKDSDANEIIAAAKAHKRAKKAADRDRNWSLGAIGLGVGIGSAAVAAALLYANRDRGKRRDDN